MQSINKLINRPKGRTHGLESEVTQRSLRGHSEVTQSRRVFYYITIRSTTEDRHRYIVRVDSGDNL